MMEAYRKRSCDASTQSEGITVVDGGCGCTGKRPEWLRKECHEFVTYAFPSHEVWTSFRMWLLSEPVKPPLASDSLRGYPMLLVKSNIHRSSQDRPLKEVAHR
jgi:hypothetical protein